MPFSSFTKLVRSKLKFGLFLFLKLPAAYLCGVRVQHLNEDECTTSVPYKWLSQNPFRSVYFACQAMAAEMSTGLLAMGHTYQSQPAVSMLVIKLEAQFYKKATERIYFTCNNGQAIKAAVQQAIATQQGQTVDCISTGKNQQGEVIATFTITWSFKAKGRI